MGLRVDESEIGRVFEAHLWEVMPWVSGSAGSLTRKRPGIRQASCFSAVTERSHLCVVMPLMFLVDLDVPTAEGGCAGCLFGRAGYVCGAGIGLIGRLLGLLVVREFLEGFSKKGLDWAISNGHDLDTVGFQPGHALSHFRY